MITTPYYCLITRTLIGKWRENLHPTQYNRPAHYFKRNCNNINIEDLQESLLYHNGTVINVSGISSVSPDLTASDLASCEVALSEFAVMYVESAFDLASGSSIDSSKSNTPQFQVEN